ncbi:DUF2927 domain-containing protein [Pelagibius sp.]|uniref:DUF2927 domain-containing protein n=1 Tax=Pelagibius sp. TaxID=1931238 RepID=UPI0026056AB1|nr:DUF2927 domain-containing protein [Pelagibius sp.]
MIGARKGIACRPAIQVWLIAIALLIGLQVSALGVLADSPDDFSESLSDEQVVENFLKIAFGFEGVEIPEENLRLFRWEDDLRIAVAPGMTSQETEILKAHLDDLARFIGLAHSFEPDPLEANVLLRVGPFEEILLDLDALSEAYNKGASQGLLDRQPTIPNMLPALKEVLTRERVAGRMENVCLATVQWSRGEVRAYVAIHTGLEPEQFQHCVVEELTQMLGLMNDNDGVHPSIFNDQNEFDSLTEHDVWLLQMLYDPVMEGGMTKDEAERVARSIIRYYRNQ